LIAAILALLVWTVFDLQRGNKRYVEQQLAAAAKEANK
jgi:manganese transport protein